MTASAQKVAARYSAAKLPKATLDKAVQLMRMYLGSLDFTSVKDQQKRRDQLDKILRKIEDLTGMDSTSVWDQVENQARKLGPIRPMPGQHL